MWPFGRKKKQEIPEAQIINIEDLFKTAEKKQEDQCPDDKMGTKLCICSTCPCLGKCSLEIMCKSTGCGFMQIKSCSRRKELVGEEPKDDKEEKSGRARTPWTITDDGSVIAN